MRLNKYISHNTTYSRREADRLIQEGFVKVNRQVVKEPFYDVQEGDKVFVKGKLIKPKVDYTVIVYNKPKGELVTKKDDRGRKTIYDSLPKKFAHYIPVGRLDFASEGLLLLTDSPKIAQALMESDIPRVYNVKIKGEVTPKMEEAMREGLELENATAGAHEKSNITSMKFAPFFAYRIDKNAPTFSKLKVALTEGKNREIRRFFAHFGKDVVDLKRVEYGWIKLNALPTGKTRYLSKKEYEKLREFLKELNANNSDKNKS
ncbi:MULTISPECIES: pseudouridine synthase [unclassified Nitratiruptor]|uniref:pseudouridine synthase n=1 Tax=unclassified Nitratiruptor TaxID=2624044 RepID=UPI001916B54D|nr:MULTISPECIES: pseudouridine synthase [unclassified Nitratiruptor]BCD59328.1 23S rRNA pseudouridine2605 synthase [Nitratiruptor sp. YY08-10]BCD63252.1 23S rRNA pseudouridine2605 synthase [Nitratiruptor sp. YY08-14]